MDGRVALPPCSVGIDEVVTAGKQWRQNHPSWLYAGLTGQTLMERSQPVPHRVELYPLGSVPLASGYLVGCDPYLLDVAQRPFTQTVPAGEHPVFCGVAAVDDEHRQVLAGLMVFSEQPIERWRLGVTDDAVEDRSVPDDLDIGEIVGYEVDSGTGCFAAVEALPALRAAVAADAGMLEDPVSVAVDSSPCEAAVAAPTADGLPIAAFRSGWGDGVYPTWFGMSEAGVPVVAMTDFLIFRDPWEPGGESAEPGGALPAPHHRARHAAPEAVPDHTDYAGRITAAEAAEVLASDEAGSGRRKGFWARLFGRQ